MKTESVVDDAVSIPDTWEVPRFEATTLFDKRTNYCVCIPVLNEGERIVRQLERMRDVAQDVDIIIADGGSTDNVLTRERLSEAGVRCLLVKTGAGGLSAQLRMAFAYALDEGYEGIVIIDGNNKDDPSAIPAFLDALDQGVDHVQGSRFVPGGIAENTPFSRLWGIRLLHAPLISLAAGFRYTDTTNGFRGYSRQFLLHPRVQPFREVFAKYELHYYLAIRASKLGLNVRELPVSRIYPSTGPVPTKISHFRGNWLVLATLLHACLGHYNPKTDLDSQENAT